jgi:hypothetical protein
MDCVLNEDQRAAARAAFLLAGYDGELEVAPVTSEDERVFLLDPAAFGCLRDKTSLEAHLQIALDRKVWVIERTAYWPAAVPFN